MQVSRSSDFSNIAYMTGRNFLVSLPILLVWLGGLALCVIKRRKAPRASLFALIALVIFFFERFFYFSAQALIVSSFSEMSSDGIRWAYFFLGFFSSLLSAAGFALLILAIWIQRPAATKT